MCRRARSAGLLPAVVSAIRFCLHSVNRLWDCLWVSFLAGPNDPALADCANRAQIIQGIQIIGVIAFAVIGFVLIRLGLLRRVRNRIAILWGLRDRWATVDVELIPSTGTGTDGVPDARITVRTHSVGGKAFTVRGRIVGYVNDPNSVPTSDYTLPWADAIGEYMEIRPHDERSVRVSRTFDDHRQTGLTYFNLFAATNSYVGSGVRPHHEVRWDPMAATAITLPKYQLEIRVYLDGSRRKPKKERFFAGPASQRGPAKVTREPM